MLMIHINKADILKHNTVSDDAEAKYYLYSDGHMAKNTVIDGYRLGADGAVITGKTLKSFLANALKPIGGALYVSGGGHDDWTGGDALRIGVNPSWKKFYNSQPATYDFRNYRYAYKKGLDCSGLVGWAVYNTLNTKSNQNSCTTTATITPKWYSQKGWGTYSFSKAATFRAGDVVSKTGHAWIVLGQCSDGSVVVIHSTPPAGVQIAGTVDKKGNYGSKAITLAKKYMKKYYPACVNKFNLSSATDITYLTGSGQGGINRFQWDISGKKVMSDPDGYVRKTPEQILKNLFGE